MSPVQPATRLADSYVVLGNPIAHSQSPFIHTMFAAQTGEAVVYDRLVAPLDAFALTVKQFFEDGGKGCNVSVPFKRAAFELADECSDRAALAGAANTLAINNGRIRGDNTDGAGLVHDIEHNAGRPLQGSTLLLIGAGGAAAGALGPLLQARPSHVRVANRTLANALSLVERHRGFAADHGVQLDACSLDSCDQAFDIVVNATASSLSGADIPVTSAVLTPGCLALDMMYGPPAAGFLHWAQAHGAEPRDGLGMLVEQAAEAFFQWRGVRPDSAPVLKALRERLLAKPA